MLPENALLFVAAWTERAVPNFSPHPPSSAFSFPSLPDRRAGEHSCVPRRHWWRRSNILDRPPATERSVHHPTQLDRPKCSKQRASHSGCRLLATSPQRHHRIHQRRSPRRKISRRHRDHRQQPHHTPERQADRQPKLHTAASPAAANVPKPPPRPQQSPPMPAPSPAAAPAIEHAPPTPPAPSESRSPASSGSPSKK